MVLAFAGGMIVGMAATWGVLLLIVTVLEGMGD